MENRTKLVDLGVSPCLPSGKLTELWTIEIGDLPMNIVMFRSYVNVYQRVMGQDRQIIHVYGRFFKKYVKFAVLIP